jgi:hypothetical protein
LCAHCAFAHDADAHCRVASWLESARLDARLYEQSLAALSGGVPLPGHGRAALHAYVGVGVRGEEPYASIHLNPAVPAIAGAGAGHLGV